MTRRPGVRIGALGLVALLQAGTFTHLGMCLPRAAGPADEVAAAGHAPDHTGGDHAAHHAADDAKRAPGGHHDGATTGDGCTCCPESPTQIAVLGRPDVGWTMDFVRVAALGAEAPSLGRTPHFLPFPNPPPTV
jgi:hypothetical protein